MREEVADGRGFPPWACADEAEVLEEIDKVSRRQIQEYVLQVEQHRKPEPTLQMSTLQSCDQHVHVTIHVTPTNLQDSNHGKEEDTK